MAKLLIGNLKPPIATTSREGISKPDGTTIGINAEGTLSSLLKASGLNITDTEGLVGEANEEVTTQALINAIADKVANQLVSNNTLTTQLANYVTKSMIKTDFEDSTETVPASSLVNQLNSDMGDMKFFTNISNLGLEGDTATPNSVIDAMPYRSALVVASSVFTNPAWNFPDGRYTLEIISVTGGRAIISLYGKTPQEADYRMFLNNENNYPSGQWTKIISNADLQTEYNVTNNNVVFRCEANDGSAIQLATTTTQLQLQKRTSSSGNWEVIWAK